MTMTTTKTETTAKTRAEMFERLIEVVRGTKAPTHEVIDWYDQQTIHDSLTVWERSAIGIALADNASSYSPAYHLAANAIEIHAALYAAYNVNPDTFDAGMRDELLDEMTLMSSWCDAFDAIDEDGGDVTSSAEMLAMLA